MKKTAVLLILLFCAGAFVASPLLGAYSDTPPLPFTFAKNHSFHKLFSVLSIEEPLHLVLVEKKRQRLLVLRHDGTLQMVASFTCATGENPGKKKVSGDSRTPEGIYFITKIFKDNKVTIFGDRALHLDYPNIFDKLSNRNGDGIYIHGTNKKLTLNSTNGCITLTNDDLAKLVQYLDMMVTPVVIIDDVETLEKRLQTVNMIDNDRLKTALVPDSLNSEKVEFDYLYIINFDDSQAVAVGEFSQRKNAATRLRGYSRGYLHFRGRNDWKILEKISNTTPIQIFPPYPMKIAVQPASSLSMANIVRTSALPAQENFARLQKKQPVSTIRMDTVAKRIQKPAPPKPRIITPPRVAGAVLTKPTTKPTTVAAAKPAPPSVTAPAASPQPATEKFPYPRDREQIIAFVEQWRAAWEGKNLDTYIASYHPDFKQDGKNLRAWRAHKARLNKNYRFISVKLGDIRIEWQPAGATVTFAQTYRSDRYSAVGTKTLHLRFADNRWQIRRELWAKSTRRAAR